MLLKADLIGVVGIGFVAVNGLGAVRVLDALLDRRLVLGGWCLGAHAAELRNRAVAALGAWGPAGIAGDGGRGLEAVQLGRGVHLRLLAVGDLGLGAVGEAVGDGTRGARAGLLLVQGVRVDKGAVARGRLGAVVEDPDNLKVLVRYPWIR